VERIVLTASGGPFFRKPLSAFRNITVRQALRHPTWSMGAKITIDSATMLNKGFEVIEAHHLFGFSYDRISVMIHPESVVHSFVQGHDGPFYGQLGPADMRIPILSALSPDKVLPVRFPGLHLPRVARLTFFDPDFRKFPLLKLAYEVGEKGGLLPAVMTAADDVAVRAFLAGRIGFTDIHRFIRRKVETWNGRNRTRPDIETILSVADEIASEACSAGT
jgi:1-deoxy-D-xylulose-5-phosphate reductoisomerase